MAMEVDRLLEQPASIPSGLLHHEFSPESEIHMLAHYYGLHEVDAERHPEPSEMLSPCATSLITRRLYGFGFQS